MTGTGVLAVVIGLGIMVLVHEWGHFVVARFFGVRVDVFSIGFGPRLFGTRRGPTDYRISALPLGGYVRMAGDNPAEERTGAADEFLSKPRWQRVLIALAGPTTNFVMAVILTASLYVHGSEQPVYIESPVVIAGLLKDSPAEKAGIQPGDRVVSFAGTENPTWNQVALSLALSTPGHPESVVVNRNGQSVSLTVPSTQEPFADLGYPSDQAIVDRVNAGMPAAKAGLKPDDVIVAVYGQPLQSPYQLSDLIQQGGGKPMEMDVRRGADTLKLQVNPIQGDLNGMPRWQIGITDRGPTIIQSYSVPTSVVKATQFHFILASKLIYTVGDLFTGRVSLKQMMGPVGIMQASGEAAKRGFGDVVALMALVSLNLAILNLLPIPILDGGHISMLAIEGLLRHDLSLKLKERFVTVGMVFLLLVFLVVMYNDVLRLFPSR